MKGKLYEQSLGPKPQGGYVSIGIWQLSMLYSAVFGAKRLEVFDLRVWFALRELAERSKHSKKQAQSKSDGAQVELKEVAALLGQKCERRARAAITSLQEAGFISFTKEGLLSLRKGTAVIRVRFAATASEFNNDLTDAHQQMMDGIDCNTDNVAMPRHLLRLLAQTSKQGRVAAILGHCIRCVRSRKGQYRARGLCQTRWLAEVFGIHRSTVEKARTWLVKLGVLLPQETHQLVMNKWGRAFIINSKWTMGEGRSQSPVENPAPQQRVPKPVLTPQQRVPGNGNHSSYGTMYKNQNQAQGCAPRRRAGFSKSNSQEPKAADFNVEPSHLEDPRRSKELYEELRQKRLCNCSLQAFLALVERVKSGFSANGAPIRNRCSTLAWLIRGRKWSWYSNRHEDQAGERWKECEELPKVESEGASKLGNLVAQLVSSGVKPVSVTASSRRDGLSDDAGFVSDIRRLAQRIKWNGGDLFELVKRSKWQKEWSERRWREACLELHRA